MAKLLSPVRTQLLYRSAAYQFWKSSYGAMKAGLQNGYAITCFDSELMLRQYVQTYKYTELIKRCVWKVGTAAITEKRLESMFGIKRPLNDYNQIWDRFMIPFEQRLSKYSGDTKSLEAGHCAWMKQVLIKKYLENDHVAILMIPLIIGFEGMSDTLEEEMTTMIDDFGGEVHNNKAVQKAKASKEHTVVQIGLDDRKADAQLKLTPRLAEMGFEVHPDFRKKKK